MHRKFEAVAVALGWTLLSCGLAFAHHSVAANFDQSKTMEVVGTVKEIAIRNPHSQITLEVAKPGGGVTEFFIEWSDKRLPNLGYFRTATLPDGTVLRDCGFAAFREGIANGKTGCEENTQ